MYSDDEDEFDNNHTNQTSKSSTSSSSSSIICINCGSSNFYRDDLTDALICNSCYTQSQSQSQRETTDYDEVMAVAATRNGRLIASKSSGVGRRKKRQSELDTSVSLPSIFDFCNAFQILLKQATIRIADLTCPIPENSIINNSASSFHHRIEQQQREKEYQNQKLKFQNNLLTKVQYIWFSYLISWNKAATFYSKLYPECRISFRDYFLQCVVKSNVLKYLTAKSVKNVNEIIQKVKLESDDEYDEEGNSNYGDDVNIAFYHKLMDEDLNRREHHAQVLQHSSTTSNMTNSSSYNSPYSQDATSSSSSHRNRKRKSVKWEDETNDNIYNFDDTHDNDTDDSNNNDNSDNDQDDDNDRFTKNHLSSESSYNNNNNNNPKTNPKKKKTAYYRKPVNRLHEMLKRTDGRIDNNTIHPYYAIFQLKPDLNLLSSIIYLALLQSNIGVSSNHFISWSYSGLYPFLINGLKYLPKDVQDHFKRCHSVYAFQQKVIPKPALLDYYADLLIISLELDKEEVVQKNNDNNNNRNNSIVMERKDKNNRTSYSRSQMNNFPGVFRNHLRKRLGPEKDEQKPKRRKRKGTKDDKESKSSSKLKGDSPSTNNMLLGQLTPDDDTENQQQQQQESSTSTSKSQSTSIQYYEENIPLMTYRFVCDLGLSQRVLDISLSLMGFEVTRRSSSTHTSINNQNKSGDDEEEEEENNNDQSQFQFDIHTFLPAPLKNASVDKIASPVHIMAVIVVACKMCFGWEQWKVHLSPHVMFSNNLLDERKDNGGKGKNVKNNNSDGDDDSSSHSSDSDIEVLSKSNNNGTKNESKEKFQQRFIPWSQDDIHLIGNGKMLNDYFDFIEEMYGDQLPKHRWSDDVLTMINSKIKVNKNPTQAKKASSAIAIGHDSVVANAVIAGATNPNMPAVVKSKNSNFFHFLKMRNKGAIWADANGFGEYVVYKDMAQHAKTNKHLGKGEVTHVTSEPFHPHYSLLIEYVSDKLFVEPGELHYLVTCLDEELIQYSRPDSDWRLDRKKQYKMSNRHFR